MSEPHTSVVGPVPGAGGDGRQRVQEVIDAFNTHDAAKFASFYSPDAIGYDPAAPEPLRGRAGIQQDAQQLITAMPDLTLQLEELLPGEGPTTAFRALLVGTHTGPMLMPIGEIAPTGRRASLAIAVFCRRAEDGLIEEEHRYYDLMGLAQQLGLLDSSRP
ncbi:DUF4440 domain-containing protein [Kocuria sediminis]|uniref:DUF4440 domain-containing protein n=1 Tax=Kocuria sediminis TaxID=1038857 RepID=A0A6N8GJS0_9MICC|nr:ester cyclase [Kocuria sediminis]MUN62492.1 DUF4440 domain-containing protein [Kocuria sediminis]